MNTYAIESLKFFFLNKFANMLNLFLCLFVFALSLWCIECRLMWKKAI